MEFTTNPKEEAKRKGSANTIVALKSDKLKQRKGECSWCKELVDQVRVTKHLRPKRSKYQCTGCFRTTIVCRVPDCKRMARAHRGWKEERCFHHTKFYKEESCTGRCSWCFDETSHTLYMDNFVNKAMRLAKVYNCDKCHRATKKCRKCKKNMARIGGTNSTGKCFECYGLISSWNPEQNSKDTTINLWCPWCVNVAPLLLKETYGKRRKDIYMCKICTMESVTCSNCKSTMVKNRAHQIANNCHLCKHKLTEDFWLELQEKYKEQVRKYEEEGFIESELARESSYREKALEAGLIKPFLLLVSMHPEMRAAVGYKIDLHLLKQDIAGDTHAEADFLLFHKKKGIRKRSNAITENAGFSQDANWYQILRRAIRDISGYSTFVSISSEKTLTESLNPNSELICALEEELLDMIAKRHLRMLPVELKEKAYELYESPEVQEIFDNVRNEGINSDAMFIVFISIIISQSITEMDDIASVKRINIGDFMRFLKNYVQGKNATTNRLKQTQEAGLHTALILTKIFVLKTVAELAALLIFPPAGVLIEVGFMAVCLPIVAVVILNKSTRDISCPAVVLIVLQNFLLSANKVQIK